jgi:hypothetical protein
VPAKVNIGALLTKHLGKEVADATAAKIDKIISAKKSAAETRMAIQEELTAHLAERVTDVADRICVTQNVSAVPPPPLGKGHQ